MSHASPARKDHATSVVADTVSISATQVGQPYRWVLLVAGHSALRASLLPVNPPETDVLVVDEITQDDVLHGVCMRCSQSVSGDQLLLVKKD
jgi:hypothetical protein